ncbi:hypothetical protein TNCV_5115161 [Trichonephila clavipes]|nr:hypothetical protein TNCV_5115161 [Trichonephila clavipes]
MFRGARKEELILIVDELEKAKLESQRDSNELQRTNPETKQTSIENFVLSVRTLTLPIPKKKEGWNLFFSSLERSFKTKNVPDEFKGEILLNLLGEKAENIFVYVKDEEISDYNKLKSLVLREFEPTPLICLQNFQKAKRMPNETHVQLASRLLMNWDQYCNLRNVNDFNSLKELIVSDKLYETLDNETAVHINIKQEQNWFKPIQMGKKCDMFYACKGKSFSEFTHRACHNQNDSRKDFKYIPPNARREDSGTQIFICNSDTFPDSSNDEFGKITLSSAFGENVEAKLIKTAIALDNNSWNHPMDCLVAITDKLIAETLIPPDLYESLCSINDKNNKKENEIFAESAGSSITFSNDENEAECGKDMFYVESDSDNINFNSDYTKMKDEQDTCDSLEKVRAELKLNKGNFLLIDGLIYHRDKILNDPVMQLVLPRCRIDIKYNFFWSNMSGEIVEFVQICKGCQLRKPEKIGDRAAITPIVRPELPFEIVNIDVMGPIQPPSGRGHKYVLCMMDQHTRWPEAVPLRSLTAKNACDSLLQIFSRTGIPSIIASDQGTNSKSALTQEFTKRIGSSPRFSCPGYPASNGLVERWNKVLKDMIHHVIRKDPRSWDRQLPFLLFAYREVPNNTTGVSPFRLLYGREALGPLPFLNHPGQAKYIFRRTFPSQLLITFRK